MGQNRQAPSNPPPAVKEPSKVGHIGSLVVAVILVVITFYVLLQGENPLNALARASKGYLLLALGLVLLAIAIQGRCLQLLLKGLGHPISYPKAFIYANIDYYFSAITPSAIGGQPYMIYYMAKDGVPVTASIMAVLMHSVQYTGALLLLGAGSLLLRPELLTEGGWVAVLLVIGFIISLLLMALSLCGMFLPGLIRRIGSFSIRILSKLHILRRPEKRQAAFERSLIEYRQGADFLKTHPLLAARIFGLSVLQRVAVLSVPYLVFLSFGLTGHSYWVILATQTITALSVAMVPLPGAIGVSENAFLKLFGGIFGPLLKPGMLLSRGIGFYFSLLFCGLITLANHLRKKKSP